MFEIEVRAHTRADDRGMDRLRDVVDATDVEAAQFVRAVFERRDEDDRSGGRARIPLQLPADLESVEAGHHHVEQDEIGQHGFVQHFGAG